MSNTTAKSFIIAIVILSYLNFKAELKTIDKLDEIIETNAEIKCLLKNEIKICDAMFQEVDK